jgi:hypothetical protein
MNISDNIDLSYTDSGANAIDLNFEIQDRPTSGPTFAAASPQGDVAGQPDMKITQTETSGGILKSRLFIKVPVFNSTTGVYPRHRQFELVVTRDNLDDVDDLVDFVKGVCASAATGDLAAELPAIMAGNK